MQLAACWILFPLLLALIAYGCGTLVGVLAGAPLRAMTLPVGAALMIALLDVAVRVGPLRPLAVPIVVLAALAGLALARPWERLALPPVWQLAAALGVFAVFAAPVVLSGHATFTGYIKLDDTATWLALTDQAFARGTHTAGLAPSSFEATVSIYLSTGYPFGAFLPLGLGHQLLGEDIAWLFAPWLAFVAAMLALTLESLAATIVRIPWRAAMIGFVAAQSALLYGYALWGGAKEVVAALLVAAFAATCPVRERLLAARTWAPALVVAAAMVASNTVGGLVWLLPVAAGALLISALALGVRRLVRSWAVLPVGLGAIALIASLTAGGFIQTNLGVLEGGHELGNLIGALNGLQVLGIWPAGDFRLSPNALGVTHLLIALAALAACAGAVASVLARGWPLALYLLAAAAGALGIGLVGSPWLAGKALATASPAFLLAGLVGAAMLAARGRGVEGAVVALALAAGVLWSNVYAYHDASLAPQRQLAELERIGGRIAGEGPTLMTEYQPYGVRHFLRAADAEGASELRRRLVQLRTGAMLPKGATADLDQISPAAILTYRTLVLRRSPLESRPPAVYVRTFAGRYYDVWQRPASAFPQILADVPVGGGAGGRVTCAQVRGLLASQPAALVAAPALAPAPTVADIALLPGAPWGHAADDPSAVALDHRASVNAGINLPVSGPYSVWLGGSVRGAVSLRIDGRAAGAVRDQLQYSGQYMQLGARTLRAGFHAFTLRYAGADWRPGSGGPPAAAGPLVIAPAAAPPALVQVAPSAAARLCGMGVYWVEALSSPLR